MLTGLRGFELFFHDSRAPAIWIQTLARSGCAKAAVVKTFSRSDYGMVRNTALPKRCTERPNVVKTFGVRALSNQQLNRSLPLESAKLGLGSNEGPGALIGPYAQACGELLPPFARLPTWRWSG